MSERLSIREAAERIGISREVAARQVRKLGVALDAEGRVDLEEFRRARVEGLHPIRGGHNGGARGRGGGVAGAHISAATDLKRLQSQRLELRLAQERGELVRRSEVERALTFAGQRIRDAAMAVPPRAAQALAGVTDLVEIKRILVDHMREFLEAYASDLQERAFAPGGRDDDDGI